MTTITFYVSTTIIGSTVEEQFDIEDLGYSEKEWVQLNESERQSKLQSLYENFLSNNIEGGWTIED